MNTNRLFVSLNSAVVIVAVMFYLSGITMAADHPKEAKPAEKTPPPQQDTFGDDGTPTFEDTPSPTFQPPPPVPAKHDDKNKEEKREKGKKDKGDGGGIGLLAVTDPDLTVIGATVTPEGNGPGDSGTLGTAATLTVVIKNQGSTDATDFRLDVWFKHPSTAPPPNFGSTGDVGIVIPLLAAGASLTTSYSFTFPIVKQAYRAWALIDSGSVVAETKEFNNTGYRQYYAVGMGTVIPPTANTVAGDGVPFRGVSSPYGNNNNSPTGMYPNHTPTVAVTPANAGTFGPIIKNLLGDASSTFFASPDYIGVATVTYTVGSDSKSGVVNISSGIVSLTFSGPGQHNVLKDNGTETYSTPHWSVGSVTSNTQSRVCYERGGTLTVSAGFVVANPGTTTGILRGVASSGGSFSSVVTIAGDGKFGVSNLACSQTVSAHVDLLHPLTIKWQVSLNGGLTFSR